ncbi:hypothetical protein HK405_001088, partial [Cladochytrium tenue]
RRRGASACRSCRPMSTRTWRCRTPSRPRRYGATGCERRRQSRRRRLPVGECLRAS